MLTLQKAWQQNTGWSTLEKTGTYYLYGNVWDFVLPPKKIPSSACQVQKGSRGPHQLDVLSFRLQNTIISTCSFFPFILVISWLDLISLPRVKIHTFQTSPNFLHPIAPFQLFVATLVSSLPFWLAKCVIPLAWYSYSHANPLRYPHLSRGNW